MAQPFVFQLARRLFVAGQLSASTPMMGFASLYPSYGAAVLLSSFSIRRAAAAKPKAPVTKVAEP